MALTYQALIDQAVEQARRGGAIGNNSDVEMLAEVLAPNALQQIAQKVASDPHLRHVLIRPVTIALTNGVGVIPDVVMIEHLGDSNLTNPSNYDEIYSHTPNWFDYINTWDRRLGYYTARGTALDVIQPGAAYTPGSGLSGNIDLTTPSTPVVPTLATDPIANFPPELENDLIALLSNLIRGA